MIKKGNEKGFILITVVWILLILSMISISLGRESRIQTSLTKYFLTKSRLNYAIWAGLTDSLEKIHEDSDDKDSKEIDDMKACGVKLDKDQKLSDVFANIPIGDAKYSIENPAYAPSKDPAKTVWGFSDEESRVNLNAINSGNRDILKELLIICGVEDKDAEDIAIATVDWIDQDSTALNTTSTEEKVYVDKEHPFLPKNRPFDSVEELVYVRGMTPVTFQKLKKFVTVLPRVASGMRINMNTAPLEVLQALFRSTVSRTNTRPEDADRLAKKVIEYRAGEDTLEGTSDDRALRSNEMSLDASQRVLFDSMSGQATNVSHYLRMRIKGSIDGQKLTSAVEAVVSRDQLRIEEWKKL